MTTATQDGRQLRIEVPGIASPIIVDPLPGKIGKRLTDRFLAIAIDGNTGQDSEDIFVQSLGCENYSRITGYYVDEFDAEGALVATWSPDGKIDTHERSSEITDEMRAGRRYMPRNEFPGEPELAGEPIRQEEIEAISLCAFYWQTVVGIEAVNAFIETGEGTAGSVKALTLLLTRTGRFPSLNSSQGGSATSGTTGSSAATTATSNSSGTVRLPAERRSIGQNPAKAKPKRKRKK